MRTASFPKDQQQGTEIIGDIEAFMAYVESGAAAQDWEAFLALRPECFARAEAEIRRLYGSSSSDGELTTDTCPDRQPT
ncbi:MAG: hypothetical protein ETSY1_38300 [Candidatus Entotheonella factor]|uniref:Uncharacterized protein n=1 Tax=Entotheonella factor TaxID=1429438 RepID=W4L6D0_ENTF1|nr:hypothetical protein [Candidatus Entotheonella palauensis]ETW93653.1 MAG: hypothetical protein ETSY1_38300 [Candidatus Entotheonella factor]